MDTLTMNSKTSKTSDPHRLLLNLSEKIHLKYQLRRGIKNFSYLTDHFLYHIIKIILNIP